MEAFSTSAHCCHMTVVSCMEEVLSDNVQEQNTKTHITLVYINTSLTNFPIFEFRHSIYHIYLI